MSNPYFRFKQFTVFHDKCGMKVGTDGVLLGAWADVSNIRNTTPKAKILDVGTGCGLIALMLAQRSNSYIKGIDIESDTVNQARENFENSPWKELLVAQEISLQDFSDTTSERFDLIVSNPPFFVNSLHNPEKKRSIARHANSLTHEELLFHSNKILKQTGKICLVLPATEGEKIEKNADETGLFCSKKLLVSPNSNSTPKRVLLEFSRIQTNTAVSFMEIETDKRKNYSEQFYSLVKDFYL
jgi:Predicted O-methyltransferase